MSSLGSTFKDFGEWLLFESIYRFINQFFGFIFARTHILSFYKETIQVGMFLIFLGLFLNFKKSHKLNEKQNTLVNFFKFTFILMLSIYFFCQFFVYFFDIPFFSNAINLFYARYRLRLYELFSGYWAVIFVLTFNYIIIKIEKKYLKVKSYQISTKRISRFYKVSLYSFIIFTSSFFYFVNFEKIKYPIYFNEDQIQAVSFIGSYFNENPLGENKTILLEDFDYNQIYGLIVELNLKKKYYNFTANLNYTQFNKEFNSLYCEFVFLNISKLNVNFKSNFSVNFDNLYEGINGYIFSKVK